MLAKKFNPAATMDEPPSGRPISASSTEYGWCKTVPGGTGQTILATLLSKAPDTSNLQNALHRIQLCHSILRSKLHFNTTTNKAAFVTHQKPFTIIKLITLSSTTTIIKQSKKSNRVSPFQIVVEHEISLDTWAHVLSTTTTTTRKGSCNDHDMFFATVYELPGGEWALVLRLHVLACDRTSAVALLRELLVLIGGGRGVVEEEIGNKGEVNLAIEDLIPEGKAKKTLWARGIDVLGYSMSSLRLTNLKFKDARSSRCSEIVRFKLSFDETQKLLDGCKARGMKLCGALVAAGLIAAHTSTNKSKKYGVVTMVDCRSLLEPPLSDHHFGFYHSAILNTHAVRGGERLWELAQKCYTAFADDKKNNKHFSDMADLNFLMGKAIENPSLTQSSSLRTSLLLIFEDTVVDNSGENRQQVLGLEDYVGCASIHGVGPSIAMFDIIQDGRLDFLCVYPAPLHSREQMQDLVDKMRMVLVAAVGTE